MVAKALFSSATDEWSTPQQFFDELHKEFRFTLDAAATRENAKCDVCYTRQSDALRHDWADELADIGLKWGAVWMNPPYGRGIGAWVAKAFEESRKGLTVVCLLPARTDTKWWHEFVQPHAEVRFVKGWLKFGGSKNSAPFPSAVVIFRPPGAP
jgi:phage N-6-adenine-methyltransferase